MGIIDTIKKVLGGQRGVSATHDVNELQPYFLTLELRQKKELSELIRTNVEAFAPIQAVANDVLSSVRIVAPDKVTEQRVHEALLDMGFYKSVRSAFYDYLIYGDAYLEPVFTKGGKPKNIVWIPASTMEKIYDEKGHIVGYQQKINGKIVAEWKPDEIIHISAFYYEWGGQRGGVSPYSSPTGVASFTPLSVALEDLRLLDAVKEYLRRYFESGGLPRAILQVDLKSAGVPPNSKEYLSFKERLKQALQENRNGVMVSSVPIDIIQLQKSPEEMQFKDLYMQLTQLMCLVWDIPLTRIYGSQKRSDEYTMIPYFARIRGLQEEWSRVLTRRFVSKFGEGIGIKFMPAYERNQVRAVTWVVPLYKLGLISPSEARELMGLPPEAPEDIEQNPFYFVPANFKEPKSRGEPETDEDQRRARDNKVKHLEDLFEKIIGAGEHE